MSAVTAVGAPTSEPETISAAALHDHPGTHWQFGRDHRVVSLSLRELSARVRCDVTVLPDDVPLDRRTEPLPHRPEIVCICGSGRFVDAIRAANRDLTSAGVIVVAPGEADGLMTDEQRTALGALHLRKIDLADRVLVVNPGGYVGESTSREIAYAHATGTPVSFTDHA